MSKKLFRLMNSESRMMVFYSWELLEIKDLENQFYA